MNPDGDDGLSSASLPSKMPAWKALAPLFTLILVECIAFSLLIPIIPILTTEYFAKIFNNNVSIDCVEKAVSKVCQDGSRAANYWSSICSSIGLLTTFFTSIIISRSSDIHGRKPFIFLSQILSMLYPFSVILFREYGYPIHLFYIFNYLITSFSTMPVAMASVADVTDESERTRAFGALLSVASVGFVLSAIVTPLLNLEEILFVVAILYSIRPAWVLFALKETLPPHKRASSYVSLNPFKSMLILRRSALFRRLTFVIILTAFVFNGNESFMSYFLNSKVGFGKEDISYVIFISGISTIIIQGVGLKPLVSLLTERGVLVVAMFFAILSYITFCVVVLYPEKWIVFTNSGFTGFRELSFAAIASLKSIHCNADEQGQVQGAIYSARSLSGSMGPLLFTYMYNHSQDWGRYGEMMPFGISILLTLIASIVACILPTVSLPKRDEKVTGGMVIEEYDPMVLIEEDACPSRVPLLDPTEDYY